MVRGGETLVLGAKCLLMGRTGRNRLFLCTIELLSSCLSKLSLLWGKTLLDVGDLGAQSPQSGESINGYTYTLKKSVHGG